MFNQVKVRTLYSLKQNMTKAMNPSMTKKAVTATGFGLVISQCIQEIK